MRKNIGFYDLCRLGKISGMGMNDKGGSEDFWPLVLSNVLKRARFRILSWIRRKEMLRYNVNGCVEIGLRYAR
ncbi:hypothetical protein SteCoe_22286 [Stentor coeruleus]|uniref:Uncharacterized protein n=1 Tax=Stentor coeruleus TaxID=5963 RepID=A0A1R2BME6_9CILI|nr:hypothetical protein SteCoe_22286 [Stentor coeruleus]